MQREIPSGVCRSGLSYAVRENVVNEDDLILLIQKMKERLSHDTSGFDEMVGGESALMCLARSGSIRGCAALLDAGASFNLPHPYDLIDPLIKFFFLLTGLLSDSLDGQLSITQSILPMKMS